MYSKIEAAFEQNAVWLFIEFYLLARRGEVSC
jgi:hypothetical protein